MNYHEILGVQSGATIDEIKKAYKERAKEHHPDKFPSGLDKVAAEAKMRIINEAKDALLKDASITDEDFINAANHKLYLLFERFIYDIDHTNHNNIINSIEIELNNQISNISASTLNIKRYLMLVRKYYIHHNLALSSVKHHFKTSLNTIKGRFEEDLQNNIKEMKICEFALSILNKEYK